MKIYLSARWARRSEMAAVRDAVEEIGHEVVSRWIDVTVDCGPVDAAMDVEDLESCDALILFTDPLGSLNPGGARHVEFGMAIAARKELIVVGEKETLFCHLPQVVVLSSVADLFTTLSGRMEDAAQGADQQG